MSFLFDIFLPSYLVCVIGVLYCLLRRAIGCMVGDFTYTIEKTLMPWSQSNSRQVCLLNIKHCHPPST